VNRGDIYRVRRPPGNDPKRSRCFVIVSRQALIDSKAARVVCAPVNTTCVGLATQVPVGVDEGLKHPSCINCDQLFTLDKSVLTDFVAALSATKVRQLRTALRIAMAVE
jgi:mRNA interferase MazF